MQLIFERGDRDVPVGHALIYFAGDGDAVMATYVSVPPIPFNFQEFMPPMFASMFQGVDLGNTMVATPIPPIPQEVESHDWLATLAARRNDDLVFAGGAARGDATQLMTQAAEAAQAYGDLYSAATPAASNIPADVVPEDASRFSAMDERDLLNELTVLTGRLRDSLSGGHPDAEIEREMRAVAMRLPAKYRAMDLAEAARIPGERGQRLAELYLERSYKLHNEEYLDLERIDREIQATSE